MTSLLVKIKDSHKAKYDVTKEIQMYSWPKHGFPMNTPSMALCQFQAHHCLYKQGP